MPNQDFFARIALDHHPVGKDELYEPQPLTYKKRAFQPSERIVEQVKELSYEKQIQKFNRDLQTLREQYQPFMVDHTPAKQIERQSWEFNDFQFRFEDLADRDFDRVLGGQGQWEQVKVPDYRGPTGKWTGFYRKEFAFQHNPNEKMRIFLRFLGVDYIANIYLNGRFVGSHEGFFAPFEFDVTEQLRYGQKNILLVEVKNDYPTLGIEIEGKERVDGDKIYAATGLGWDDPVEGWHHCPPGAGIYNKVILEERSTVFIHDLFVKPDIDNSTAEAWVEVYHTGKHNQAFDLQLTIFARNFQGESRVDIPCQVAPAGPGVNFYRMTIPLTDFRLWNLDTPWLYTLRAAVSNNEEIRDEKDCSFGMRKFHMDEETEPKGTLYMNNQPIILRGANEMGHLQQCIMQDDFDQLVDDILIAKLVNMNYYRITQRPVQSEIYDYCDMLGMMHQCDLPLFGYLRRNQFTDAVRQAGEMECLIRSHPSSIMVSFINEPFPIGKYSGQEEEALYVSHDAKGHRHLYRDELEAFFDAARKAVLLENPDRVIKNVEGDYDPPTNTGLSDFHCYNLWYTNHALPIGKLLQGYLPAIKKGWKTGCGEYGTEGLDNHDVMLKSYPREWLPKNDSDPWFPDKIIRSQTHSMHGDWFAEQHHIKNWIKESQLHQAIATKLMTDALRRRSDLVVSTAIHLLIDAWPAGWMKALVGCDRVPKPAYFAYQNSLEPIRVNLHCDRRTAYEGDIVDVETWVLNDTAVDLSDIQIAATIRTAEKDIRSFEVDAAAAAVSPTYAGTIFVEIPEVNDRQDIYVDAILLDKSGKPIYQERLTIEAFTRPPILKMPTISFVGLATQNTFNQLHINSSPYHEDDNQTPDTIVIHVLDEFQNFNRSILKDTETGATTIFSLEDWDHQNFKVGDISINIKTMNGLTFLARNDHDDMMKEFKPDDFSFWNHKNENRIDFIADHYIESNGLIPLIFTYQKPDFFESTSGQKQKLPVVGSLAYGKGRLIFSSLRLEGFEGVNPILDRFLRKLFSIT